MSTKRRIDWDECEKQVGEKRKAKPNKIGGNSNISKIINNEEMTVQRLSPEMVGKTPKYTPLKDRQFVPFRYAEFTLENIKKACLRHYELIDRSIKDRMLCDVLASDKGPSCSTVSQLQRFDVIYVRFVDHESVSQVDSKIFKKSVFSKGKPSLPLNTSTMIPPKFCASVPPTRNYAALLKTNVDKSITVSTMMDIGKCISNKAVSVHVSAFDINSMTWIEIDKNAQFLVEKERFSEGAFRDVFKATSINPGFKGRNWVIKYWKPSSLEIIQRYQQTPEQQCKKVVQMHSLARHFASTLSRKISNRKEYGKTFAYNEIFFGVIDSEGKKQYVTIEEFIVGTFVKYLNNTALCKENGNEIQLKAESLSHFSFETSKKKLLLTDIQGCGYTLCDPEIASAETIKDNEILFGVGNLSMDAINNFKATHVCNRYCDLAGLVAGTTLHSAGSAIAADEL